MFEWFKNLFAPKELQTSESQYYYVGVFRGTVYIKAPTIKEAEEEIQKEFEKATNGLKIGGSFFLRSRKSSWKIFRSNWKIVRMCRHCGLDGNGCGQC